MKVKNMTSSKGNKVANQFILSDGVGNRYFQSYDSVIVCIPGLNDEFNQEMETWGEDWEDRVNMAHRIQLDKTYWDYSTTTGRYRNQFLGESKAETQKKIDSGEYELVDLN